MLLLVHLGGGNQNRGIAMKKVKFMDLDLFVSRGVFTPRPETELLVNVTLYALWGMGLDKRASRILEIGTGTGVVAISLTKYNRLCKLVTSDIESEALNIAKVNARINGVSDRIEFMHSDIFGGLSGYKPGAFDVVVSNPPYVARWEIATLSEDVRGEPRSSIDGGEDGLDFYRRISAVAPAYLKRGGFLIMEMGYNQSFFVKKLLEKKGNFTDFEIFKDSAGIDRVIKTQIQEITKIQDTITKQ